MRAKAERPAAATGLARRPVGPSPRPPAADAELQCRLARLGGNQAIQRLARNGQLASTVAALRPGLGNQAIQRLAAYNSTLYVPSGWAQLSVNWGGGKAKIADLLKNGQQKHQLIGHLETNLPLPDLGDVAPVSGSELGEAVKEALPASQPDRGQVLQGIQNSFQSFRKLLTVPGVVANLAALPAGANILLPSDLLPEPDDLTTGYDVTKACALIALVKSEGKGTIRTFLQGKEAASIPAASAADSAFYLALHQYFYDEKHVLYDDTSTHGTINVPFGYHIKLSGPTTFGQLWRNGGLVTGKKYILDLKNKGHTVYVTMKKNLTTDPGAEQLGNFFTLHNDPTNYNLQDAVTFQSTVLYVHEK